MKNIDERLKRLEALVKKELLGNCTFTDGTTQPLDVLDVVLYALCNEQPRIACVEWQGDASGAGVLPAIAEMFIAEPPPAREVRDFM